MRFVALCVALFPAVALCIGAGTCKSSTRNSITISVPSDSVSDFYDVQFGLSSDAREHSLHWSNVISATQASEASARLWDLKANTTYYFWVRHHLASAYRFHGLSEGWGNFSAPWACTTSSEDLAAAAPSNIVRKGALAPTELTLSWTQPQDPSHHAAYKVEWCTLSSAATTTCDVTTNNITTKDTTATLTGLAPASRHLVRVCGLTAGDVAACGDEYMLRTGAEGRKYVKMYRVTTGEVDFLSNHNTADIAAQSLFMTGTESATGVFQPFKLDNATVSESCVEMVDVPYADYVSCNHLPLPKVISPEQKYDFCTCAAYTDRMYARQNRTWLESMFNCVGPVCKCSIESFQNSMHNVGRQPIFWPGPGYYKDKVDSAGSTYPLPKVPCGWWYSTPRKSECKAQGDVGASCSWWQHPISRVVRAQKLKSIGWNATAVKTGGAPQAQVFHNAKVLAAAFVEMEELVAGRCCGC